VAVAAAFMVMASLWLPRGGVDAAAYSTGADPVTELTEAGLDRAEPASA